MRPDQSIMPERPPVEIAKRISFSPKVRAEVLLANGGRCYLTNAKIMAGDKWDVEHVIPLAQGGTNDPANLRPALASAHKIKTAKDAADTAKARRRAGETCQGEPARKLQGRGFGSVNRKMDGSIGPTRKAQRAANDDQKPKDQTL
tara:strand:- start:4336 stop:4773 length:438 start_codon:yes stop_codon:yes gene_type:complete